MLKRRGFCNLNRFWRNASVENWSWPVRIRFDGFRILSVTSADLGDARFFRAKNTQLWSSACLYWRNSHKSRNNNNNNDTVVIVCRPRRYRREGLDFRRRGLSLPVNYYWNHAGRAAVAAAAAKRHGRRREFGGCNVSCRRPESPQSSFCAASPKIISRQLGRDIA